MPFNQKSQVCKEVGKHDPCIGKKKSVNQNIPRIDIDVRKNDIKTISHVFEEFRGNIKI